MNPLWYQCPPGLLFVSVFYWGWYMKVWPLGLIIGGLMEVARWSPWRLQLSTQHFKRVADVTAVVLFITSMVFFIYRSHEGLFLLAQWSPLVLSVLLAAQLYSESKLLPLQAIVVSLRKKKQQKLPAEPLPKVDLQLPYVFFTVLAVSIVGVPTLAFYLVLCGLTGWALWGLRPKQYHGALWSMLLLGALSLGFVIQIGINQLQGVVQEWTSDWFEGDWSNRDAFRNSTFIGQLGKLKLSEKIVMRVHSNDKASVLLQQAVYNRYQGGTWIVNDKKFTTLPKQIATDRWLLSDQIPEKGSLLAISAALPRGEGILALPLNAFAINSPSDSQLARNINGAVHITAGKETLIYNALYHQENKITQAPLERDLEVPHIYQKLMSEIVNELNLAALTPVQKAQRLKKYFSENFQYSLIQDDTDIVFKPLTYFLHQGKKGHCEYFATAGTLLLRAAGIPARYVSGFLMEEYDPDFGLFLVRKRHAHAWTIAYINGQWIEFDYTPSTWAQLESDAAPWWVSIYDTLSHLSFVIYQWWEQKPAVLLSKVFVLVGLILAMYFLRKRKTKVFSLRWNKKAAYQNNNGVMCDDSPFHKIVETLETKMAPRNKSETLKQWLNRLHGTLGLDLTTLNPIVDAHYRFRFSDPISIDADSHASDKLCLKLQLARQVDEWLQTHPMPLT